MVEVVGELGAGISVAFMLLNSLFPVESVYLFGSPAASTGVHGSTTTHGGAVLLLTL